MGVHGFLAVVPWAAIVPLLVLSIALQVYCLVDLTRSEVRYLPRWGWALLIVLANPVGAIVYLMVGRPAT